MFQNIDFLEPYEDEFLFSWIIRMAKWYGIPNLSHTKMRPFMETLFGLGCKPFPSFYVPERLDHLIETINLPQSKFFNSSISVIEKMTVFPFYTDFLRNTRYIDYCHIFNDSIRIQKVEEIFNMRQKHYYLENALNIKFCMSCIQESNNFYLNREHQIQENYVCYKHEERLRYFDYNNILKDLDTNWNMKYSNSKYYISENDSFLKIRVEVARAIHQIFHEGLVLSNTEIKSKLRKKLVALGYFDKSRNYFLNIEKFWNDFSSYNMVQINEKQLFHMIFTTSKEEDSVAYITLIMFLFETLDEFKKSDINDNEIIDIKYSKYSYQLLTKPKYGIRILDDYNQILRKKHNDEYEAISIEGKGFVRVIHKKCGNSRIISKNYLRKFKKCPSCGRKKRYLKCKSLITINDPEYIFLGRDSKKRKNIKIIHKNCGRELSIPINSFEKGKRCFYCFHADRFKQKVYDLVNDEYLVLKYEGTTKKALLLHNVLDCMQPFEYLPHSFLRVHQCPFCGKKKDYIGRCKSEAIKV
jgi:hypothetical protein